jgi:hypothetical protein
MDLDFFSGDTFGEGHAAMEMLLLSLDLLCWYWLLGCCWATAVVVPVGVFSSTRSGSQSVH